MITQTLTDVQQGVNTTAWIAGRVVIKAKTSDPNVQYDSKVLLSDEKGAKVKEDVSSGSIGGGDVEDVNTFKFTGLNPGKYYLTVLLLKRGSSTIVAPTLSKDVSVGKYTVTSEVPKGYTTPSTSTSSTSTSSTEKPATQQTTTTTSTSTQTSTTSKLKSSLGRVGAAIDSLGKPIEAKGASHNTATMIVMIVLFGTVGVVVWAISKGIKGGRRLSLVGRRGY